MGLIDSILYAVVVLIGCQYHVTLITFIVVEDCISYIMHH